MFLNGEVYLELVSPIKQATLDVLPIYWGRVFCFGGGHTLYRTYRYYIEPSLNQFSITLYYRLGVGGGLRIPYGASGLLDETGMCETPLLLHIRKYSSTSVKNKGYSLSFYRGGLQSVFYVVPYTVVIFGCRICYSPPFSIY